MEQRYSRSYACLAWRNLIKKARDTTIGLGLWTLEPDPGASYRYEYLD